MKRILLGVVFACGLLGIGLAGLAVANSAVGDGAPAIMVSPSTIVLAKVSTVTVHSNIPAALVEPDSLDLDGAAPTSVGIDSCGHVVAKFAVADLNLAPGRTTLTLSGVTIDGGGFSAADSVTVK